MPQPQKYTPGFNFTDYQTASPTTPLPANEVDSELTEVQISINQICDNLAEIQRDDGALRNSSVGPDQLQPGMSVGVNSFSPWFSGHNYLVNNCVSINNAFYYCRQGHLSSNSFSADLAAGDWGLILDLTPYFTASIASLISPISFRNVFSNGDMRVAQAGTSFAGLGSLAYTLDGWFGRTFNTTTSLTHSQQAGAQATDGVVYPNVLRVQRTAAQTNTSQHTVGFIIPSEDVQRYAGKSCQLSFCVRKGANFSAVGNLLGVSVQQGSGVDQGSAAYTAVSWTNQTQVLNQTQTINSTLTRYTIPLSFLSTTNEIAGEFSFTPVGTAGANDYFEITGLQLEVGTAATMFEQIPFADALRKAKRTYRKSFPYAVAPVQNSGNTAGALAIMTQASSAFGGSFEFDVPMLKAPAVTTYNPSAANANWRDVTNSGDKTVTVASATADRVLLTGASGVANAFNQIHYVADARL